LVESRVFAVKASRCGARWPTPSSDIGVLVPAGADFARIAVLVAVVSFLTKLAGRPIWGCVGGVLQTGVGAP